MPSLTEIDIDKMLAEHEQRKKDKQSRQEQRRHEELQQHRDEIAREVKQRAQQEKTAPQTPTNSYTRRWLEKMLGEKKKRIIKTKQGGRVKQMVEGGTVARGSGAAWPQRFGRNG